MLKIIYRNTFHAKLYLMPISNILLLYNYLYGPDMFVQVALNHKYLSISKSNLTSKPCEHKNVSCQNKILYTWYCNLHFLDLHLNFYIDFNSALCTRIKFIYRQKLIYIWNVGYSLLNKQFSEDLLNNSLKCCNSLV